MDIAYQAQKQDSSGLTIFRHGNPGYDDTLAWVPVDTHSTPVPVATGRLWVAPRATIAHTQTVLFCMVAEQV